MDDGTVRPKPDRCGQERIHLEHAVRCSGGHYEAAGAWREVRIQILRFSVKNAILSLVFALMAFSAHADTLRVLYGDAHFPVGPVWHLGQLYYVEYDLNSVTS